ncbi:MAG: ester cyclase [Candidatus Glassbacteria bacterium]
MSEEKNKELVRRFYALIDNGELEKVKELMTEDYTLHYVGIPEPLDGNTTIQLVKGFYTAFPDYVHVIDAIITAGNEAAVRLTFHATHQKEFEGIPATGKPVTYSGMHMITITRGKVRKMWALEDSLGLMQQIGMELKPKVAE